MSITLHKGDNYGGISRLYYAHELKLRPLYSPAGNTLSMTAAFFAEHFKQVPFRYSHASYQQSSPLTSQGRHTAISAGVKLLNHPTGLDAFLQEVNDHKLWLIIRDQHARHYFVGAANEGVRLTDSFDTGSQVFNAMAWDLRFTGDFTHRMRPITFIA